MRLESSPLIMTTWSPGGYAVGSRGRQVVPGALLDGGNHQRARDQRSVSAARRTEPF
jgi:hypothetical protein